MVEKMLNDLVAGLSESEALLSELTAVLEDLARLYSEFGGCSND